MRRFRANNHLKGRIQAQMPHYIDSKAIQFENGNSRNSCIIVIDESKIEEYELSYMYQTLIPTNREIQG